jgi:hypothetical protein
MPLKLNTWRQPFISWLSAFIPIDSQHIDYPDEVGKVNLMLPPLRNIKIYDRDENDFSTATQDIYLTYRLDRNLSYGQLGLENFEGIYSSIGHKFLNEYQEIADILEVFINPSENAITVTELGDRNGDWLVTLSFIITIRFINEPVQDTEELFQVLQINTSLWNNQLVEIDTEKPDERTLDQVVTTPEGLTADGTNVLTDEFGELYTLIS